MKYTINERYLIYVVKLALRTAIYSKLKDVQAAYIGFAIRYWIFYLKIKKCCKKVLILEWNEIKIDKKCL